MSVVGSQPISKLATSVCSILFHDFALIASFGFYNPTIGVTWMMAAVPYTFLAPKLKNLRSVNLNLILTAFFYGQMAHISVYAAEYYARQNCLQVVDNWLLDRVTPRMITCYL